MAHRRRVSALRILLACLAFTVITCVYLALYPVQEGSRCSCPEHGVNVEHGINVDHGAENIRNIPISADHSVKTSYHSNHTLAIIVPLRDRFEELMDFAPHMHSFLNNQSIRHKIIVINQIDNYRFNRASLINVGFLESNDACDYIAMHDVDLLPENPNLKYYFPGESAYHVAAPNLHPLYHYKTFVGGILILSSANFRKLNGMSNRYWGWGREDDEFYVRMKKAGILVERPVNITTGNRTFKHVHDRKRRPRDNKRYFNQTNKTRRLDRETGVSTVQYEVVSHKEMTIDLAPVTVYNVKLICNVVSTPWCLQPEDHDWYLRQYPHL